MLVNCIQKGLRSNWLSDSAKNIAKNQKELTTRKRNWINSSLSIPIPIPFIQFLCNSNSWNWNWNWYQFQFQFRNWPQPCIKYSILLWGIANAGLSRCQICYSVMTALHIVVINWKCRVITVLTLSLLSPLYVFLIVRRAGLLWSQQDFEWRWSVPLFKCLTVLEFSFILFDLCLLITFFNFIMNYVPIVTFWIFTYHKIWILSIMFCFIWSYWIIYFLACLEVSWRVVS